MYDELGIEKVIPLWDRLPKDVRDKIDELIEAGKDNTDTSVHGKWIPGREIAREMIGEQLLDIDYENYKCSACGLIIDRLLYCVDGSLFYKYCPNCGTKMDDY